MTRPDLLERHPTGAGRRATAPPIALEPLGDGRCASCSPAWFRGCPRRRGRIVARAEGVPAVAVETVRMLIDRGQCVAERDGYVLAGTSTELAVPETLHALVAARIDAN